MPCLSLIREAFDQLTPARFYARQGVMKCHAKGHHKVQGIRPFLVLSAFGVTLKMITHSVDERDQLGLYEGDKFSAAPMVVTELDSYPLLVPATIRVYEKLSITGPEHLYILSIDELGISAL